MYALMDIFLNLPRVVYTERPASGGYGNWGGKDGDLDVERYGGVVAPRYPRGGPPPAPFPPPPGLAPSPSRPMLTTVP